METQIFQVRSAQLSSLDYKGSINILLFFKYKLSPNPAFTPEFISKLYSQSFPRLKQAQSEPPGSSMSPQDREFMMRYLQLKYSILFLQRQKFIGKYCFYGCWCLPNGAGDLGAGTGPPVDNIDKRSFIIFDLCIFNIN